MKTMRLYKAVNESSGTKAGKVFNGDEIPG